MDGNTEPLIAVIGHPIAGNSSQLAIERSVCSLGLDYRVTSFDVSPENVAAALDGLDVLGFCGVLVDPVLASNVGDWIQKKSGDSATSAPASCLFRDLAGSEPNTFSSFDALSTWMTAEIQQHLKNNEDKDPKPGAQTEVLWLGGRKYALPSELSPDINVNRSTRPPTAEMVSAAELIVLSSGKNKPVAIHPADWPENDGTTLVVDLTDENHDEQPEELVELASRGYRTLTGFDRKAGVIQQSVQRWTGQKVQLNIIRDAMEEYLGV